MKIERRTYNGLVHKQQRVCSNNDEENLKAKKMLMVTVQEEFQKLTLESVWKRKHLKADLILIVKI